MFPTCKNENINAFSKQVFVAFIQCHCLLELSTMLYNCKLRKQYIFVMETSNAFMHALCHLKALLNQRGPLELIKTMLKSFHIVLDLSKVLNSYLKGSRQ